MSISSPSRLLVGLFPPEGDGDELEKQMATAMEVRMGGDTGVVLAAEPQKQH
jgi:hypothetical protein